MKKSFLWSAICILIGEIVISGISILVGSMDPQLGRIMGAFFILDVFLFVGVNNFVRIENEDATVRFLGWMSLICNAVCTVLAIMFIFDMLQPLEATTVYRTAYNGRSYSTEINRMTILAKTALVTLCLGVAGFWTSNVMAIKETIRPIRPLKITAMICELYTWGFWAVVVMIGYENLSYDANLARWAGLTGLTGFAFVVTTLLALILSWANRKKADGAVSIKDNKEMEATIQDMVEKEVQARLKAEKEKEKQKALPPLQSDDMPPVVRRDGEIHFEPSADKTEQFEVPDMIVGEKPVASESPVAEKSVAPETPAGEKPAVSEPSKPVDPS